MTRFESWWRLSAIAVLALSTVGALGGGILAFSLSNWDQLLMSVVGGVLIACGLSILLGVGLLIHWLASA